MSVIERVMKAYASKYDLAPEQAALVRVELSNFINELMSGKRREPTMLPETKNGPAFYPAQHGNDPETLAEYPRESREPVADKVSVVISRT